MGAAQLYPQWGSRQLQWAPLCYEPGSVPRSHAACVSAPSVLFAFSIQYYCIRTHCFFIRFLQVSDQSHPSVSFRPRPARRCGWQWQTKLDLPCRPPLQHGCVPAHPQQGLQHRGPKGNSLDSDGTIQSMKNWIGDAETTNNATMILWYFSKPHQLPKRSNPSLLWGEDESKMAKIHYQRSSFLLDNTFPDQYPVLLHRSHLVLPGCNGE